MLPAEILTDAVSFLSFYDHEALIVANRQLSRIALTCIKKINSWKYEAVAFLHIADIGSLFTTSHSYLDVAKARVERTCMTASLNLRQAILDAANDVGIRFDCRNNPRMDTRLFLSDDDEAVAIFKLLESVDDCSKLRKSFVSLTPANVSKVIRKEAVLRAAAFALFARGHFDKIVDILANHHYSVPLHPLQKMWYEARYKQAESRLRRKLGPVDKYRIRKKFPLPMTFWDDEGKTDGSKDKTRKVLREHYLRGPYPDPKTKNVAPMQVGNWSKNSRQRVRAARDTNLWSYD